MKKTIGKQIGILATATLIAFGGATAAQAVPTDEPSSDSTPEVRKVSRYEVESKDASINNLEGVHVAIDPGHSGGNLENLRLISNRISDGRGGLAACDTVGRRALDGYREHEFTFELAQELAAVVEELGGTVSLTRADDEGVGPCLDIRGRFAEDVQADILISLHSTNTYSPTKTGFAVEVSDPPLSPSQVQTQRTLAYQMAASLARLDELEAQEETILGVRETANNPVLNFARRPAVSIEVGNLRHEEEAEFLRDELFHTQAALAIAEGIMNWQTYDTEARR